jgi:tol-pal system protein YbgF
MATVRSRFASCAAVGVLLVAAPLAMAPEAIAQTPINQDLSKRDAKRIDDLEKVVDELRKIVFKGRDTGKPVEVEVTDSGARLAEVTSRLADLEQTLVKLNGSLETTAHQLDQARKENAALQGELKDLNQRVVVLEQKAAAPPPAPAETAQAAPPPGPAAAPADPNAGSDKAFAHARQLMLSGDYDQAQAAFRDYVQAYPDGPKTPEARYWWGKTLAVGGSHAEAATAYIGAIRGWPKTPWAPDAVVELSRELVALKKPADACQALAELPKHYPKPPAAVETRAAAAKASAKCEEPAAPAPAKKPAARRRAAE